MTNYWRKVICLLMIIFLFLFSFGCADKKEDKIIFEKNNYEEKNSEKEFPNKPIQIVVPYSPGGGTDSVARSLAWTAEKFFNVPIVVVNKEGDGGAVGMSEGVSAQPDGYTVTMMTVELVTLSNLGLASFTYEDFKPILQVNADPAALTVKADAQWNNVDEFIEYARKNPNKIKIGNSGVGAIWHLAAAGIEKNTGVKFEHIFFDGAAPAVVSLLGGEIDAVTVSPAEVLTHVRNGKLKVLAVLSPKRISSLPNVPTFAEEGYDFSIGTWRGLGVPKDTPDDILKILQEGFEKAARDPEFINMMNKLELGYKIAKPNDFLETIKLDDRLVKNLIENLGY